MVANEERRFVTILFCDVTGSTAMAEQLDPEDWADIMREAFDDLIQPIERYEGTVARLMGDAMLAFFGAPVAHEDDPQRATLAALEIIENIQPLRQRVRASHSMDFNVRVGINSGTVVVGEFGAVRQWEYTAMGDAINLAARMEQTAEPGAIQVAHPTFRLIAPYFEVEPVGRIEVKGKAAPVPAYRVTGRKPLQTWSHRGGRRPMPLVGHEREMAALQSAYERLKAGQGHIVLITGEAGTGKSRLVEELRAIWQRETDSGDPRAESVRWLENRLVPYETSRPYGALAQRLRRVFNISRHDDPDQIRTRVHQATQHFPEDVRERASRVIQRLLLADEGSLGDGIGDSPIGNASEFREEVLAVTTNLLGGWNSGGPVILVGDDHHWFDEASAELLAQLFHLIYRVPILIISVFRPYPSSPVWNLRERVRAEHEGHFTEIVLEPLTPEQTGQLLEQLVSTDGLPEEFLTGIRERSDGNPMFIEEIIYSMVDQGVLVPAGQADGDEGPQWRVAPGADFRALAIPDSLRALLMERIDRLPVPARRLMQYASVIGRSFSVAVLKAVAGVDGELEDHIALLEQLDIIRPEMSSEREYTFRHAMIWEAAYGTILKRDRRVAHRRVAEAMEQIFAESVDEQAEQLGQHYFEANDQRGIIWLTRAAERAQRLYAPSATLLHATRAIELSRRLHRPAPARIYQVRARAYELDGKYDEARGDLELARDIANKANDPAAEWQALIELGTAWFERDYSKARAFLEQALEMARRLRDDRKIAHSLNRLGNWHANVGHPRKAVQAHQAALATSDILDDDAGRAEALDLLGTVHYLSGDMNTSAGYFERAVTLYRKIGDRRGLASSLALMSLTGGNLDTDTVPVAPQSVVNQRATIAESLEISQDVGWRAGEAFALSLAAFVAGLRGEYRAAMVNAQRAREIAERIGHRQWLTSSNYALGVLNLDLLQFDDAELYLSTALALGEELGSAFWRNVPLASLAAVYLATGQHDRADELLDCRGEISYPPQSLAHRRCWFQRARLALARGDFHTALQTAERLIDTRPPGTAISEIPHLALTIAEAHLGNGHIERSRAYLNAALEGAGRCGYRPLHWRALVAEANLARASGDARRANAATSHARMLVHELASEVPDTDVRSSFLDRSEAVLHAGTPRR